MKYIIFLPWWKETNAFAVTEDTPPSHIGAHKTCTHVLGLKKTEWKAKSLFFSSSRMEDKRTRVKRMHKVETKTERALGTQRQMEGVKTEMSASDRSL